MGKVYKHLVRLYNECIYLNDVQMYLQCVYIGLEITFEIIYDHPVLTLPAEFLPV